MILNVLLIILTLIVEGLNAILPTAELPDWISSGITDISLKFESWNFFLPMDNFVLLLTLIVMFEGAILSIYGILAIIKIVRGSG